MISDDELRKKIIETVVEGHIKCAQALAIAKEMKVAPDRVGDVLNQMNIKIISCQLGCFQ